MKLQSCGAISLNYPLANNTSARLISMQQQASSPGPVAPLGLQRPDVTSVFFFFPLDIATYFRKTKQQLQGKKRKRKWRHVFPPGSGSQESQQRPEGGQDFC